MLWPENDVLRLELQVAVMAAAALQLRMPALEQFEGTLVTLHEP
jgi:hypothetical protein